MTLVADWCSEEGGVEWLGRDSGLLTWTDGREGKTGPSGQAAGSGIGWGRGHRDSSQ